MSADGSYTDVKYTTMSRGPVHKRNDGVSAVGTACRRFVQQVIEQIENLK